MARQSKGNVTVHPSGGIIIMSSLAVVFSLDALAAAASTFQMVMVWGFDKQHKTVRCGRRDDDDENRVHTSTDALALVVLVLLLVISTFSLSLAGGGTVDMVGRDRETMGGS